MNLPCSQINFEKEEVRLLKYVHVQNYLILKEKDVMKV